MDTSFKIYVATLVGSALITAWITAFTWKRRKTNRTPAFTAVLLAITYWLVISIADILTKDAGTKLVLNKLGYLGVLTLPVAWFVFSMQYSRRGGWMTPVRIGLLLVIPAILEIIVWRGDLWSSVTFTPQGDYLHISATLTAWKWPMMTYSYGLIVTGSLLLVLAVIGMPPLYRYQAVALVLGAVVPLAFNAAYLFNILPSSEYDLTPISFAVTGITTAWGLFRYRLFSLVPIARNTLVDNLPMGFIGLNERLQVADLNPAAEALLGLSRAQALGEPLSEVFPPGFKALQGLFDQETAKTELRLGTQAQPQVYELTLTRMRHAQGEFLGFLVLFQDITPRMEAEWMMAAALDAEKELSAIRSRLITSASHEFRTPLSVIFSSVELLENYGAVWPESKRAEHMKRVKTAVQHMTRMVEEILVVGRLDAGKTILQPEPLELVSFCEAILEEIRLMDRGKHRYIFEHEDGQTQVTVDELQLRQAVSNLLENAGKYSPAGRPIWLELSRRDGEVQIHVIDQGYGIPESDLPHLGEPFYRGSNVAHLSGTGLGLSIVKRSLELIGGILTIHSSLNAGTHVIVSLPSAPGDEPRTER